MSAKNSASTQPGAAAEGWGPEWGSTAPAPGGRAPLPTVLAVGVFRGSPLIPFLLPSLPPSGLFFLNFLLARSHPLLPTPPSPFSPLRGPEGTSDFSFTKWELSTSSISQGHIKKSRQVQVNHEMVTF